MNTDRKFVFLLVAIAIAVAAILVLPGKNNTSPDARPEPVAPTQSSGTATRPAREPRKPEPPLLSATSPRKLTVTNGDVVRFRVRSATDDEVHVHGYDRSVPIKANRPKTISLLANIEGIFEIELEISGKALGELTVEPK